MIVLRDPAQLSAPYPQFKTELLIASLSALLQQCFQNLGEDGVYDPEIHGYIVVAEPGDAVSALEAETGCPLLGDWFGDSRYGDDDYAPSFDYLAEHPLCYEMNYITNDDGYTVLLIVPKLPGIDPQLFSLCRENSQQTID